MSGNIDTFQNHRPAGLSISALIDFLSPQRLVINELCIELSTLRNEFTQLSSAQLSSAQLSSAQASVTEVVSSDQLSDVISTNDFFPVLFQDFDKDLIQVLTNLPGSSDLIAMAVLLSVRLTADLNKSSHLNTRNRT